ncbi:maltokinase N-terminal cap-like domain-containing protein [Sinomonas albida]|uniref:maltokinase N-terminal cap-like domain-containing protein n=1 Tax=Sinomonas albida TaxID=369942 RepID=UPI00301859D9
MAIIHRATLVPSKLELIDPWLDLQGWAAGSSGELSRRGSYRLDDPDGEVGIEGFLISRGETTFHLLLTYRAAPLDGGDSWLIGTMQHSALGERWAYDGLGDPVAVAALARAAAGRQAQAELEVHDDGAPVGRLEPDLRVHSTAAGPDFAPIPRSVALPKPVSDRAVAEIDLGGTRLSVARTLGAPLPDGAQLVAEWAGGQATLASLT